MKIGIKQFSNKFDNYKDYLIEYWEKQKYDYIELYVAPNQLDNLPLWYELKNKYGINYTIHAPHFSQGVNLADKNLFDHNKNVYQEVNTYAKELDVEYTVVHAGMDGSIEEVAKQINSIKPYKIKIENKPYVAPRNPDKMICRGATIEEIKFVMGNCNCEFNLDIGHAFCSAVSQKLNQFEYLDEFLQLNPTSYHLSDGIFNDRIDIHYHLNCGDYDWNKIFPKLNNNINWTLETITKKDTDGFDKVLNDIAFLNQNLSIIINK